MKTIQKIPCTYAENGPAIKRNEAVGNDLPGQLYTIEANGKIPDNCKYPLALIQVAENENQTNTGGLGKLLKGCACYICASLFLKSKRKHLSG